MTAIEESNQSGKQAKVFSEGVQYQVESWLSGVSTMGESPPLVVGPDGRSDGVRRGPA